MKGAVHRGAERRFAPWKNGGGETAEILCSPEGAGYDDFDWRISTARVGQSGPFSSFHGVHRSLTVIEGGAMRLTFDAAPPLMVGPETGPVCFPGDVACHAELIGPALLDLNVMVRAPFGVRVVAADTGVAPLGGAVERFVFARDALPALGLERHDLQQVPPEENVPPLGGALVIDITRQARGS
ncbi:HutD family protein [Nitratireductor sp. GISD-1A_MAKvit]|uniref:HutD/Ves family protein n=1 Tax=Nitratireductor sp. GISD-1A_MAKvit TaxID=3234198 RepID=UPI003464FBAC